jgi:purine-nucleoside phosphorylase
MIGRDDDVADGGADIAGFRDGRPSAGARAAADRLAPRLLGDPETQPEAGRQPRLGVVLGSGLGCLAERLENAFSVSGGRTGWLPPATATGHEGRLVCGTLQVPGPGGGRARVVALQGRSHGYEGHPPATLARGVDLLAALGVETVVLTNASGGLRPDMRPGDLVVVADHLDLVRRPGPGGAAAGGDPREGRSREVYDPRLVRVAVEAGRGTGAGCRAGVYAHMLGPTYETRAEYRMLRLFGADCVGMSTVPEALAARRLGLRVAAVSVVTNVANPDAPGRTDAEDVCRAAATAADAVWAILHAVAAASGATGVRGAARSP